MMELKEYDSLVYLDLTLVHEGGGHKITMDEKGKRSGDLSFADIVLQASGIGDARSRFYHPEGGKNAPVEFGNYLIAVVDMNWNGALVTLDITQKDAGT